MTFCLTTTIIEPENGVPINNEIPNIFTNVPEIMKVL